MGGSSGFSVDGAGIDQAVGQLQQAGRDFTALVKAYEGSVCYDPAAFGQFGMDGAWQAFDSTWSAELTQTSKALAELTQQVRAAATAYRRTDDRVAHRVQAVPR